MVGSKKVKRQLNRKVLKMIALSDNISFDDA
jgi:hypothetical protein